MTIRSITLTGVDQTTNLYRLAAITRAARAVRVEWAVLYSPERAGGGGRYPSLSGIRAFSQFAARHHLSTAIHVCGTGIDELLSSNAAALELTAGFGRVQLNFDQQKRQFPLHRLEALIRTLNRPVITQHNEMNDRVSRLITAPGHQLLVDSSRGAGISPRSWPQPTTPKPTGYAGGLGPDNLSEAAIQIEAVAGVDSHRTWVDMESKLIGPEGRFDVRLAERCVDIIRMNAERIVLESDAPGISAGF